MACFASEIEAVFVIFGPAALREVQYVETSKTEVSVDTQLIRSKSVRAVRLISLLNDDLLPVCSCLFPSTTRFDPNNRY